MRKPLMMPPAQRAFCRDAAHARKRAPRTQHVAPAVMSAAAMRTRPDVFSAPR